MEIHTYLLTPCFDVTLSRGRNAFIFWILAISEPLLNSKNRQFRVVLK
jgi:hypothetical protein